MTDKIIVDGVDVSGCEWYQGATLDADYCHRELIPCNQNYPHEHLCQNFPNCLFKQLARKIQECEGLKKANDEKNEFLQKLGIASTGEFRRIKHYIDSLQEKYNELETLWEKGADTNQKLIKKYLRHQQVIKEVETLIQAAIGPEQTPDSKSSLDALYKALNIIKEVKSDSHLS